MTRETKIGLLVGLAFIIVVGILLSDHMAATTEPIAAPLDQAASTARTAMVSPGESRTAPLTRVVTPQDIAPPAPVPTAEEIAARQPVQQIAVGGPAGGGTSEPLPPTHVVAVDPRPVVPPAIVEVARQNGESLVNGKGEEIATNGGATPGQVQKTTQIGTTPSGEIVKQTVKTYTVQEGDTLTKIAARTMGSGSRANVALLIKANPVLKENPDLVVIGANYTIPSPKTAAVVAIKSTDAARTAVLPLDPQTPAAPTRKPVSSQYAVYTVKENDTLWHIAQDEVGSSSAVQQIKDLNADTLKGKDVLRAGMRLRLPSKVVASAD